MGTATGTRKAGIGPITNLGNSKKQKTPQELSKKIASLEWDLRFIENTETRSMKEFVLKNLKQELEDIKTEGRKK